MFLQREVASKVSTSRIIQQELQRRGEKNSFDRRTKQQAISGAENKKWVLERIKATLEGIYLPYAIVDALCMPWDIEWLTSLPKWTLFYYEAPIEVCLARRKAAALKGEEDSKPDEANMTIDEFREILGHETAVHIPSFKNTPGAIIIDGNAPIEDFGRQHIAGLLQQGIINQWHVVDKVSALFRFYTAFNAKIRTPS